MNILVIASRVPFPLEKGDKLRLYHQLKHLSSKHTLTLCALQDHALTEAQLEALFARSPNTSTCSAPPS